MSWPPTSELRPLLLRACAALLLLFFAFELLGRSDPAPALLVKEGARKPFLAWNLEGTFSFPPGPLEVVAFSRSGHSALRARSNPCPEELAACRPSHFEILPLGEGGQRALHFSGAHGATIELQRAPLDPFFFGFLACLLAAFAVALRGEERVLALAAAFSGGLYLSVTQGLYRGLDVAGHLEHVVRIARDGPLVAANACWECFQPPAYYLFASAFLGFPRTLGPAAPVLLQGLSLFLHAAAAPLVVRALRLFAQNRRDLLLYGALVLLWPGALLQSARLGNDSLLSWLALATLCLLLLGWTRAACATAAGALLVKQSALVLVALAGVWALWLLARRQVSRPYAAACAAILLAGLTVSFGVMRAKGFDTRRFGALAPGLQVHNSAFTLFVPRPIAFVQEAFTSPWQPGPNRTQLPNYFWKTSLFGEWNYEFPHSTSLGQAVSLSLLLLLALTALAWLKLPSLFPALALLLSFGALAAYRMRFPFANNGDFRFVSATILLPVALILSSARGGLWPQVLRWATFLFLALTELFFIFLWFSEIR